MNHLVPDFDIDNDYFIPGSSSSSSLNPTKKSAMVDDDIMELLWQNGQVVMQSQTQQSPSIKKSSFPAKLGGGQPSGLGDTPPLHPTPSDQNLFIQEDEMASWLHYPLHDEDFCSDLLYSGVASTSVTQPQSVSHAPPEKSTIQVVATKPPIPPQRKTANEQRTVRNFGHFSRLSGSNSSVIESGPSIPRPAGRERVMVDSSVAGRESTMVASSVTQSAVRSDALQRMDGATVETDTRRMVDGGGSSAATGGACSSSVLGVRRKDMPASREASTTSCPRVSTSREEQINLPPATADDRKRKGKEADEIECHSEDTKQGRGLTSAKRSRAAEVHNLSERRRRDRINEKMRALQELIPRCNKSDKASMLDEAIEYLKSLQLQVQMMSMGCGMVPMMYPGMQHYMPHVAIGMGMGMGMDMGMNRPLMPFPNILAATPHMGGPPRFSVPPFPVPNVQPSDPSRTLVTSQPDAMINAFHLQHPNQPHVPSFFEPCHQQLLGLHPIQPPLVQSRTSTEPGSSKPKESKEPENLQNHPAG